MYMKHLLTIFFTAFILFGYLFSGCTDDNGAGQVRLRFSADTLSYDTVFSTIGSTTAWITIYNTENHDVTIDEVCLQSLGQSGFRINLDGESLVSFTDVEIPARDSLFLFVELTAPVQQSNQPVFLEDAVLFKTAEGYQQIVLEAWCWDAEIWHGKTILADTTLTADKPIIVYDSLFVAENVTLTMNEGTTLYMHDGGRVLVDGTIKAKGSLQNPVTFRGDRLDDIYTGLSYDQVPGQWYYIQLKESSFNNEFDHVNIRGGYYGVVADSSSTDQVKLTLTNSVIHNAVYSCLYSVSNQMTVSNSELSNSGSYTVCIIGGKVVFTHCTIANQMEWLVRDGYTLVLANYTQDAQENELPFPLEAEFRNTLVYGNQSEEIGLALSDNELITGDVKFRFCLLRTRTDLGDMVEACNCNPSTAGFLKSSSVEDGSYTYDFRIGSLSPARDVASVVYSADFPYDLTGKSRFEDSGPDIGAYEFQE